MVTCIGRGAVYAALCALLAGCTQQIDFEHDVPQRAKSIAVIEANKVRASMEVPELRQQYQHYTRQRQKSEGRTLADLEKEKQAIERKIAVIVQANSGKVCPICRKKYGMKSSKKVNIVRKKPRSKTQKANKKRPAYVRSVVRQPGGQGQPAVPPQGVGAPLPGMPFGAAGQGPGMPPQGPQPPMMPPPPPQVPRTPGGMPPTPPPMLPLNMGASGGPGLPAY